MLAEETKIWNRTGYKSISDLEDHDHFGVESFDVDQKYFIYGNAKVKKRKKNKPVLLVAYSSGKSIKGNDYTCECTPDTKFLVSTNPDVYYNDERTTLEWVRAADLKEGMRLVSEDSLVFVRSVVDRNEKRNVYQVSSDANNYEIEGGIVIAAD